MRSALLSLSMIGACALADVRLERWSVNLADGNPQLVGAETPQPVDVVIDPATPIRPGETLVVVLVIDNTGDALAAGELVITEPLVDDLRYLPGSAGVLGGQPLVQILESVDGVHFSAPTGGATCCRALRWVWQETVPAGARLVLGYRMRLP